MVVNPGVQTVVAVPVDPVATAVRGNSNMVRSDIPPVQSGEGVKYTRGRPSDHEDVDLVYTIKRKLPRQDEDQPDDGTGGRHHHGQSQEGAAEDSSDGPEEFLILTVPTEEEQLSASLQALPPEDTSIVAQMRQRHLPVGLDQESGPSPADADTSESLRVISGAVFSASYKPRDPDPTSLEVLV